MERNLTVLRAMQLCQGCQFFLPVFYLFLRENGLTWQQVFAVEATFTLSVMLCQLPAGLLADRLGPKFVLMTGFMAGACSLAIHANATEYQWFLAGHALLGLFIACHSAGLEAMTYATLATLGREDEFRRTIGWMVGWALFALAASGLLGGLLAVLSLRLTVWFTWPMFVLGALLALQLRPPPRGVPSSPDAPTDSMTSTSLWSVIAVMLVNITLITATTVLAWLAQPYQAAIGLPEWCIGVAQALSLFLAASAAHWTHTLEEHVDDRSLLVGTAVVIALSFAGMAFVGGMIGVVLLVIGRGCFGIVATIGSDLLHRLIAHESRSRTQAIQGAAMRGTMAVSSLAIGTLIDSGNIAQALTTSFVVVAAAMTITLGCLTAAWPGD